MLAGLLLSGLLVWAGVSWAQSISGGCTWSPCKPSITVLPSSVLSSDAFGNLSFGGFTGVFNNNLTGAITADGGAVTGTNNTGGGPFGLGAGYNAQQIYEWSIGPGSTPAPSYDGLRGVAVHNLGSTVLDVNGVSGYVVNLNTRNGSAQVSTAFKGIGVCAVNNCSTWGIDTIVTDNEGQVPSTGTGRFLFNEFDYNITSPNTTLGMLIGGTWLAQPFSATGPTILKPSQAGNCTGSCNFQYAFGTGDGAATNFAQVGAAATSGNSVNSQGLNFNWFDSGGVKRVTTWAATPGGFACATSPSPGTGCSLALVGNGPVVNVSTNGGYQVNNLAVASADSGANAYLCSGAGTAVCNIGQVSSVVSVSGGFQPKSLTVAGLPPCGSVIRGQLYQVSDMLSPPTYRQTGFVGGGSVQSLVLCNGSAWEAH